MSRVIERCPNCGVEHEITHVGPCEVCGSELRFWCRLHSKDIGWLNGPDCPACAREATAAAARPAPPSPPPRPRHPPRPPRRAYSPADRAPPHRDLGDLVREEVGRRGPAIATGGASLAWRLLRAGLVTARAVFVGILLFGLAGIMYGMSVSGAGPEGGVAVHTLPPDVIWMGLLGVVVGAIVGFLWGVVRALGILFSRP